MLIAVYDSSLDLIHGEKYTMLPYVCIKMSVAR